MDPPIQSGLLQGCTAQLREDDMIFTGHVGILPRECDEWSEETLQAKTERLLNVQDGNGDLEESKDTVTSQPLVAELIREARAKELEYFEAMTVWIRQSRADSFKYNGKAPISVRWIDVNKGDDATPEYRSRLVAREI